MGERRFLFVPSGEHLRCFEVMGKRFGSGLVVTASFACVVWLGCKGQYSELVVPPEDGGRTLTEGGSDPVDAGDRCPTTTPILSTNLFLEAARRAATRQVPGGRRHGDARVPHAESELDERGLRETS